MSVRCGIVGAPNAGKSTLFNALTRSSVAAESFPFCTIEPNTASAPVPDPRLRSIAKVVGVSRIIPVVLDFVDIAGLVRGASRGEGLGNRFLSYIREMDVIAHVVRRFDDHSDWESEIDIVNLELMLADLETVTKALDKATRRARTGEKSQIELADVLTKVQSTLERAQPVNSVSMDSNERAIVQQLQLISAKSKFYVQNIKEDDLACEVVTRARPDSAPTVFICAQLEEELAQLTEKEQASFRTEMGYDRSAIDSVVYAAYSALDLCTFFTFNDSEVRAWSIPKGTTAKKAAGKIHTDMEQGFIRVEVMSCEDLISLGGEQAVRKAGKLRIEGKTYRPREGEILRVRFNP